MSSDENSDGACSHNGKVYMAIIMLNRNDVSSQANACHSEIDRGPETYLQITTINVGWQAIICY